MVTLQFVQPTDSQKTEMKIFRDKIEELYKDISNSLPANRGKSISMTKLEECSMWVNKSITENC